MYYLVRVSNSVSQCGNGSDIDVDIVMKSSNIAELQDEIHQQFLWYLENEYCVHLNGTERIQVGSNWEDWEEEPEECEDILVCCEEYMTTWEWLHFHILSDDDIEKKENKHE